MTLRLLLLLLAGLGLAQPFPALRGVVAGDGNLLDEAAVNAAAQPLVEAGLRPLVLLLEGAVGDSMAEAEGYFDQALEHYGLSENGVLRPDAVAIFIGTRALPGSGSLRPLILAYHDDTLGALARPAPGGTEADRIRNSVMLPRLQAGDFTGAVQAGLAAIQQQLAFSAPTTAPAPTAPIVTTPAPPTPVPTPTPLPAPRGPPWLLGGLLLLGGLGALFSALLRRRAQTQAQESERRRLRSAKGELSQFLIDLSDPAAGGHLPDDPEQQADMALLMGVLSEDAPEEAADWRRRYAEAAGARQQLEQAFRDLQRREDEGEAAASLTLAHQALQPQVEAVTGFLRDLSERYHALQAQLAQLPERQHALERHLLSLGERYPDPAPEPWPRRDALLAPLGERLAEARQALAEGRQLWALRLSEALGADLATVARELGRLLELSDALFATEQELEGYRAQGLHLGDARQELGAVRQQLAIALGLVAQGEYRVLDAQVEEVSERAKRLPLLGRRLTRLQQENAQRLGRVEEAGEALRARIEEAATLFEAVSAFAPANWRDIRGNGSEAQKAALRAERLWEQAAAANALDGPQQFEAASRALDAAEAELAQAERLVSSIAARLAHLRQAQATAREELSQVEAELRAHRAYLSQPEVDREVGSAPEGKLEEVERLVGRIRAELAQDKPDWLGVMESVQAADRMADEARSSIRSEQEAMAQRRRLAASERAEAEAALARMARFMGVHDQDVGSAARAALEQAHDAARQAEALLARSESLSEAELSRALEQAASGFDRAERLAEEAFVNAERDFAGMEQLRAQAAEASAKTRAAYAALRDLAQQHGLGQAIGRSLQAVSASLPDYDARLGREGLRRVVQQAQTADEAIAELLAALRQQVQAQERALQQQRLEQLEHERRRAAARARQSSSWGSWPSGGMSGPALPSARPPSLPRSPAPRPSGGRRSSGSWGGGGRKSGGGW